MKNVAMSLVLLSILGFVLAVTAVLFTGPIADIGAEAFSRASANLALIAIGLAVVFPGGEADNE